MDESGKHNKQANTLKQAHLILATSLAGVCAVSSLTAAEVARLALTLVPVYNQGEKDVYLCDTQSCSMT